jgi:hypothetical protein
LPTCLSHRHLSNNFNNKPRKASLSAAPESGVMEHEDGTPMFAFQDLDYIPYGYSGTLAPYIETSAGTMRAAATLMCLGLSAGAEVASTQEKAATTVVCDLGCGDGDFRNYTPLYFFCLKALVDDSFPVNI